MSRWGIPTHYSIDWHAEAVKRGFPNVKALCKAHGLTRNALVCRGIHFGIEKALAMGPLRKKGSAMSARKITFAGQSKTEREWLIDLRYISRSTFRSCMQRFGVEAGMLRLLSRIKAGDFCYRYYDSEGNRIKERVQKPEWLRRMS